MHTQYRRGHEAHGRSRLQILPYLRNYRFLWKAARLFCRLLHVSTLILTSRAVVLEIRMGQTERPTDIHTDTQNDYRNPSAHPPHAPRVNYNSSNDGGSTFEPKFRVSAGIPVFSLSS